MHVSLLKNLPISQKEIHQKMIRLKMTQEQVPP
jgi:hypothetical protein